jgi:hypothetical protein
VEISLAIFSQTFVRKDDQKAFRTVVIVRKMEWNVVIPKAQITKRGLSHAVKRTISQAFESAPNSFTGI